MIHICIKSLFIQLMPGHTYLFQSLSFTYDHWLSRLKVMQDLQSVDYVPKWYWKFEILCHADFHRARYGVSLERGPFDKRTADYVWMIVFGALSLLVSNKKSSYIYSFFSPVTLT